MLLCTSDSQITVLKCAHRQNLHVDTTPTTITRKHIFIGALYVVRIWYESQVVSANLLALLGVKYVTVVALCTKPARYQNYHYN